MEILVLTLYIYNSYYLRIERTYEVIIRYLINNMINEIILNIFEGN